MDKVKINFFSIYLSQDSNLDNQLNKKKPLDQVFKSKTYKPIYIVVEPLNMFCHILDHIEILLQFRSYFVMCV